MIKSEQEHQTERARLVQEQKSLWECFTTFTIFFIGLLFIVGLVEFFHVSKRNYEEIVQFHVQFSHKEQTLEGEDWMTVYFASIQVHVQNATGHVFTKTQRCAIELDGDVDESRLYTGYRNPKTSKCRMQSSLRYFGNICKFFGIIYVILGSWVFYEAYCLSKKINQINQILHDFEVIRGEKIWLLVDNKDDREKM